MQQFTVNNISLAIPSILPKEVSIPLYMYSNSYLSGLSTTYTPMTQYVDKLSTNYSNTISQGTKLHTLSTNWPESTLFSLEITMASNNGGFTANAALFETSGVGTLITESQVSLTNSAFQTVRSGKFSLKGGSNYGVTMWNSTSGYFVKIVKAQLIAFP